MESAADAFLPDEGRLVENLAAGAVRGGAAALVSQGIKFFSRLGLVMVMARLISPRDFGTYAMAEIVYNFLSEFKDLGLSAATIQRPEIGHRQVSLLFWINAAFGLFLAGLAALLAPVLAWFYRDPRLTSVALTLAATFVLIGLGVQHQALLQRQMRLVALHAIAVASFLLSGAVMIACAWRGAGYWAYALGAAAGESVNVLLLWLVSGWRPSPPRLGCGARELVAFGGKVTGSRILEFLHRNADNVLVGRFCGAAALGYYVRAYSLLLQPIIQVFTPLASVAVPALSRLQDDPERFRAYILSGATAAAFLSMPLVAFSFVDTREIVLILAGRQWLSAEPIFHALAPAAFLVAPLQVSSWVLLSLGRTRRLLWAGGAACLAALVSFLAGLRWGPVGVAAAYSVECCLTSWPLLSYSLRSSPVSAAEVVDALWRPALASLGAGGLALACKPLLPETPWVLVRTALDAAAYLAAYMACWLLVPGGRRMLIDTAGLLASRLLEPKEAAR